MSGQDPQHPPGHRSDLKATSAPTHANDDATVPPPTMLGAGSLQSPPPSPREELDAGVIVAGRYRIISMLGEGGMGRVYRADDLTLGVSVALKFLPSRLTGNHNWLARFREEVRTARRISHGNVCRVHDIGEHDGRTFLSMEYVDGEDLSSLLRRIGRLPYDKALSVARQICMGVAAAHEAGVLHRDLKPANVMLDGRGNVRLTDFGIAARDGDITSGLAGTPAYMAPEQARGEPPTRQSDIYSLGLVLYELFTGKPAQPGNTLAEVRTFHNDLTSGVTITVPSSLVNDVDAATERAILRCLDPDPAVRPTSAFAVAASLPGGDPLAAALAAGETPSPELVALAGSAGTQGGTISLRAAIVCAVAATLLLAIVFTANHYRTLLFRTPTRYSPPVLVEKAKDHLAILGASTLPPHDAWGLSHDTEYLSWAEKNLPAEGRWDALARGSPRSVVLWYRAQPNPLQPTAWYRAVVSREDPRDDVAQGLSISVDTNGRLVRFIRIPAESGWPPDQSALYSDHNSWGPVFAAAGLDITKFTQSVPERITFVPSDARFAWVGTYPDDPSVPLRVETAALRGVATEFRLVPPWRGMYTGTRQNPVTTAEKLVSALASATYLAAVAFGIYLARRNIMMGRADRVGAFRLAVFVLVSEVIRMTVARENILDVLEGDVLGRHLARGAWAGAIVWLVYLAIEPFVRRFWPQSLVSWMRLLSGRLDDLRVRRDVLAGLMCGLAVGAALLVIPFVVAAAQATPARPAQRELDSLRGIGFLISSLWNLLNGSVAVVLLFTFLLVGLRQALRRNWLAYLFGVPFVMLLTSLGEQSPAIEWTSRAIVAIACTTMVVRFGLLAACVTSAVFTITIVLPITIDPTHWTSTPSIVAFLLFAALFVWCIRGALPRTSNTHARAHAA
jgi:hypothetical protein